MRTWLWVGVLSLAARTAGATGFSDHGNDIQSSAEMRGTFDGALRLRGAALYNLDLDRGATPSGEYFFPISMSQPERQMLYSGDFRLRTDLAVFAPGGLVAVRTRIDVLDNVAIGGSADGIPGGTLTQRPPTNALRIKRALWPAPRLSN